GGLQPVKRGVSVFCSECSGGGWHLEGLHHGDHRGAGLSGQRGKAESLRHHHLRQLLRRSGPQGDQRKYRPVRGHAGKAPEGRNLQGHCPPAEQRNPRAEGEGDPRRVRPRACSRHPACLGRGRWRVDPRTRLVVEGRACPRQSRSWSSFPGTPTSPRWRTSANTWRCLSGAAKWASSPTVRSRSKSPKTSAAATSSSSRAPPPRCTITG